MTDVFRSEILAVVMQQIVDEPVLPVLFLRTVGWFSTCRLPFLNCVFPFLGYTSSDNLQVTRWLRVDNFTFALDHEKDLDDSAALGGLHSVCGVGLARELSGVIATPERTAAGTSGQATALASPAA